MIDTITDGSSNFSTTICIKKSIEAIAVNEHLELYDRCLSKSEGTIDMKLETNKIRIKDTVDIEVEKKLKAMNIDTQHVAQIQPIQNANCEVCAGPHLIVYCVATAQQVEEIKFLKKNNPYSNNYNPGWKNHPNFS